MNATDLVGGVKNNLAQLGGPSILNNRDPRTAARNMNDITDHKRRKIDELNKTNQEQLKYAVATYNSFGLLSSPDATTEDKMMDEEEESSVRGAATPQVPTNPSKNQKLPPITITSPLGNYNVFIAKAKSFITGTITVSSGRNYTTKIFLDNIEDRNKLIHELKVSGDNFIAHPLKEEKPKHVVLKGMFTVETAHIQESIETQINAKITKVVVMKQRTEPPHHSPLYLVTVPHEVDMGAVRKIKYIMNCKIYWDTYRNRRKTTQCYRCQDHGHGTLGCHNKPRCVKCDKPHLTKDCPKDSKTKAYCVNCTGEHRANSSTCPVYIQRLEMIQQRQKQSRGRFQMDAKNFPYPRWQPAPTPEKNPWETRRTQTPQQPQPTPTPTYNSTGNVNSNDYIELQEELAEFNNHVNIRELIAHLRRINQQMKAATTQQQKVLLAMTSFQDFY